jgi:hypothetical protein
LDLLFEQTFDGSIDRVGVGGRRRQQPATDGALSQQFPDSRKLDARRTAEIDRNAVDADGHDRTGSFARERGVRTIW